jgi:gluconokinase
LILILMGVTGSGKTTVGTLLAQKLGWQFADADDFHSEANKTKMAHGIPLTDADRAPWLATLRAAIEQWESQSKNVVLACSALKRSYRDQLRTPEEQKSGAVRFVYLKGDYDLIRSRLRGRQGHFATEAILKSQFADMEEPEDAITFSVDGSREEVVARIQQKLSAICGQPS